MYACLLVSPLAMLPTHPLKLRLKSWSCQYFFAETVIRFLHAINASVIPCKALFSLLDRLPVKFLKT